MSIKTFSRHAAGVLFIFSMSHVCAAAGSVKDDAGGLSGLTDENAEAAAAKAQIALALLKREQIQAALNAVNDALSLSPQLAIVQHAAAQVSARVNNMDRAEEHYRSAVRLAPDDPYIRQDYGRFLCSQRRYAQADEQFQIEADIPSYLTPEVAHLDAGLCTLQVPDRAKAMEQFVAALRINSKFPDALIQVARLEYEAGHTENALGYLQRASRLGSLSPEDLELLDRLQAGTDTPSVGLQTQARPDEPFVELQTTSQDPPVRAPVRPLPKRPVKAAALSPNPKKTAAAKSPAKSFEPTPAEQAQLQFPGDFSNDTKLAPHGSDWVLTQPPGYFTLQLLTSARERDVMAYLKHHELKHMMAYCRYSEHGQINYALLYGSFSSSEHAHEAEADLPESLRVGAIFVRRYANLQGLIKPQ